MKPTGPTNTVLRQTIAALEMLAKQHNVPLWDRLAQDLRRPTRIRRRVNLFRITKHITQDDICVVPGKVLGTGVYSHKNTIAAWDFSALAKAKINKTGKALTLHQLMKENPQGKKVRIIG